MSVKIVQACMQEMQIERRFYYIRLSGTFHNPRNILNIIDKCETYHTDGQKIKE